ncbi:hypothetical protein NDU88_001796 [Pleurodeles waltl]|uniref:Uncharacterized protein n=1 Tax=Pleurodeles waltl TaxID=8319 RepID=A0AAV7LYP1_PLEWA|nr:hypothetical protein NDU88_001796 [Pleurodeles waltl]
MKGDNMASQTEGRRCVGALGGERTRKRRTRQTISFQEHDFASSLCLGRLPQEPLIARASSKAREGGGVTREGLLAATRHEGRFRSMIMQPDSLKGIGAFFF